MVILLLKDFGESPAIYTCPYSTSKRLLKLASHLQGSSVKASIYISKQVWITFKEDNINEDNSTCLYIFKGKWQSRIGVVIKTAFVNYEITK